MTVLSWSYATLFIVDDSLRLKNLIQVSAPVSSSKIQRSSQDLPLIGAPFIWHNSSYNYESEIFKLELYWYKLLFLNLTLFEFYTINMASIIIWLRLFKLPITFKRFVCHYSFTLPHSLNGQNFHTISTGKWYGLELVTEWNEMKLPHN